MTMLSLVFIIFALIAFLVVISVGALIGVLVYRDATKKEMSNPILWALLAVFAPSFIGLIIYFIVRSSYPKNNSTPNGNSTPNRNYQYADGNNQPFSNTNEKKTVCSFCGCPIQSDYVKCPHCGVSLQSESNTNSETML